MKTELLKESTYEQQMREQVVPFLSALEQSEYIQREDGKKIHYVSYVPENHRDKIVLISHGFTESAEKYQEVIYYFLKEGFIVYMPEHCGHGYSYRLSEDLSLVHLDSYTRYVKDFLYLAEKIRKKWDLPLYVFAHSMGGGIAAAAASAKPQLFDRLALSSPMIRPQTGGIPWAVTKCVANLNCILGKGKSYVPGAHPFDGKETFEDSASLSEARFRYYQEKKNREPKYQTCAASYGWLREAARLNGYLRSKAVKRIKCPVLLFQADQDAFVSPEEQDRFIERLCENGNSSAKLVLVANAKHEIYNSGDAVIKDYWDQIFSFLEA